MFRDRKIVLYELNEVPHRVLLDFVEHHPDSTFARLVRNGRLFESVAEDTGVLSPWITWPTLHRGVTNEQHCISDFGQDLSEVNAEFPSFTALVARSGRKVGVFGSLHTYPLPRDAEAYAFYVPDTFANGPECFPETLSAFQDFNLKMMDASGRNVSRSVALGPGLKFLARAPALGLRADTMWRLAGQVVAERLDRARAVRRRTSQAQIAFDMYLRQLTLHKPELSTFFTNHVASSMHRYWPAKFPGDFKSMQLDDDWRAKYSDEIDFAMSEADRHLAHLVSFVTRNAGYVLVVASSMGQAAVDASTVVHHQLYITDIGRFMRALGVEDGSWEKHRAMLPRYIFRIAESAVARFRTSVASVRINGEPLQAIELGSNIFQLKLGQVNLGNDNTIVLLKGGRQPPEALGLENVAIDDETGSYAYHVPNGTLLVYDPAAGAGRGERCGTLSTCEVAPAILANFAVPVPGYMRRAPAEHA